jgi:hypothetical protein
VTPKFLPGQKIRCVKTYGRTAVGSNSLPLGSKIVRGGIYTVMRIEKSRPETMPRLLLLECVNFFYYEEFFALVVDFQRCEGSLP